MTNQARSRRWINSEGSGLRDFPFHFDELKAGTHRLFDDERVHWFLRASGGVQGKSILELGPLEGAHTWMLDRAGARQITAIEGNRRAWMRCLVVKELLSIPAAEFLCGNFVESLRNQPTTYDAALACGVLYHMKNPVELLALLARRVRGPVLLWTQFYDETILRSNRNTGSGFDHKPNALNYEGFHHTVFRHQYGGSLFTKRFYGGNDQFSNWLPLKDLLNAIEHFGFRHLEPYRVEMNHANGPAMTAIVSR